jgi:uncharacterized protein (TIGR02246 family)
MSSSPRDRGRNEATIRAVERVYDTAWNVGDVRSLVAIFAQEAVVVNPLGEMASGRAEIERVIGEFLSVVSRVQFVTDDVAVVDGEATLEWLAGPNGATAQPLVHRFTDVLIKKHGTWFIAHVRAYVLMTALSGH